MVEGGQLTDLITYIDENIRASSDSGIDFIDPRNYKKRLASRQNHVIYGRRGAGKTSLVSALKNETNTIYAIRINLEDFKDISFPNVLIHVLLQVLRDLKAQIAEDIPRWRIIRAIKTRKFFETIEALIGQLEDKLKEPDTFDKSIREKTYEESSGSVGVEVSNTGARVSGNTYDEKEIETEISVDKLDVLRNMLPSIKEVIQKLVEVLKDKAVFIIFDDFYFLKKKEQPYFIDFFHRLAKDSPLFIKVATIKHRSKLYVNTGESYYGMEIGHDIQEIDLDYTLDRFADLMNFMKALLNEACKAVSAEIDINELMSSAGFKQLCLASGGVPRDFLSLFVKVASLKHGSIGKVEVTNAAIASFPNKYESFKSDSAEERVVLESCLNHLKQFVIEDNRTNIVLVPNEETEEHSRVRKIIKELVDLRMLHLVDANTSSAPSDGKMYSAYMIDIGSYKNPKQRNFKQIEPGIKDEKSRKDDIRSAPRLKMKEFYEIIVRVESEN